MFPFEAASDVTIENRYNIRAVLHWPWPAFQLVNDNLILAAATTNDFSSDIIIILTIVNHAF